MPRPRQHRRVSAVGGRTARRYIVAGMATANSGRREVEYLDQDMTPADILEVLARLQFRQADDLRPIKLDAGVRDYLVATLSARRRKA